MGDASRRLLPDEVADRIQAEILSGTLRPGDRLPTERELADRLQVNRSSVREALKKLEQLRLISIQQGSGIRVRRIEEASFDLLRSIVFHRGKPSRDWLADLLELREALLPAMLRLGLERSTAAERGQAAALLRRASDLELPEDAYAQLMRRIQDDLARMTRNQVVKMLSHSIGEFMADPVTRPLRRRVSRERRQLVPVLQRLAIAVEARDLATADRAIRDLMRRLTRAVLDALEPEGPPEA